MTPACPPRRSGRSGFTLVELLVVIGIIALLIGILLPSLNRAREASYKTKCLANLHQIALAMIMYTNENRGIFPASGRIYNQYAEDFVWWQEPSLNWIPPATNQNTRPSKTTAWPPSGLPRTVQQDQDQGALVRYMGSHFVAAVWTCPSDNTNSRPAALNGVPYPYSYTMNDYLSCEIGNHTPGSVAPTGGGFGYMNSAIAKIARIRRSSGTVMMLEESDITMNDADTQVADVSGTGNLQSAYTIYPGGTSASLSPTVGKAQSGDWMSIRHDSRRHNPDNLFLPTDQENIPGSGNMGNVAFVDGHCDYVSRYFVHSKYLRHWDPTFQN